MYIANLSKKIRLLALAMIIGAAALVTGGIVYAHGTVDQSQLAVGGAQTIGSGNPGQEFTPSKASLVAVDAKLRTRVLLGDSTITAIIRKGTIGSPILVSAAKSVPEGFSGLLHFDFPNTLTVAPGEIYVLELAA